MNRLCETGRICWHRRHLLTSRVLLAVTLGAGLAAGCATNTETGMLVGGAGGAAAGAAIGSASGHAGTGALIGGAVGLIGGGLVGNSMDQADHQRQEYYTSTGAYAPARAELITQDDVIGWSRKGTSDEVIVDRIERASTVFHLTAADESALRDKGVSEDVVRAMKETERR